MLFVQRYFLIDLFRNYFCNDANEKKERVASF